MLWLLSAGTATPTPAPAMTEFVGEMGDGFTVIMENVVSACATIVSNPFLLFTCIFLFAGGVVGIIGRLLSRN